MFSASSSNSRQIATLIAERLIPWLEEGAPLASFANPPRATIPMEIVSTRTNPLPALPTAKRYPHVQCWTEENLNSIDAPVLGCVFDGEMHYHLSRPPGEAGMQWKIKTPARTFFLIPPGNPFTRGVGDNANSYARAILIHLRRDCISCFTYTIDHGKVWQNPYVQVHEFDAQPLAWRLLEEWRRSTLSVRLLYRYSTLLLDLVLRALQEKRFTDVHATTAFYIQTVPTTSHPDDIVEFARNYIAAHLENPDLSNRQIALHCGVSARHLERLFRERNGETPAAYVSRHRFAKAKVLLQRSTIAISSVGYYCGFHDPSHFSRWFARMAGHSPRQFRKENKQMSQIDN